MKPSLGVLIPYFNEKGLLREGLESLLSQRDRPDAILIYDDASSDPPDPYVPKGFPIPIVRGSTNQGPSHSRNILLQSSRSDYVHFHDADDLFSPDWCGRVREAIGREETDAVFTELTLFGSRGVIHERAVGLRELTVNADLAHFCFVRMMPLQSITVRRETASRIGAFRESFRLSEDWDFQIRLGVSGIRFSVVNEPLILKRVRPDSQSANMLNCWIQSREVIRQLAAEIPAQYRSELSEAAARNGCQLFRIGARQEARESWKVANQLGRPTFRGAGWHYRLLARTFGAETAESMGQLYRKTFPKSLRRRLADKGW